MKQYPLRDIDDDLWRKARIRTTQEGISIRDVLVRALELYNEHGKAALWPEEKRTPKRKAS
jgi:plasmid stability protein